MGPKEKKQSERIKITRRAIDSIPEATQGQTFIRDSEIGGFGIRITPGHRTFILEKRVQGKPARIAIGPYPSLSVEDARKKVHEWIVDIANGKDPRQEIQEQKQESTLEDLIALYRSKHLPKKRSAKNDQYQIEKHLLAWEKRKLLSIERKDIVALHDRVGKESGFYAGNRLVSLLRKMWNLGRKWGMVKTENPATGIDLFREEKRERFIKPEEVPRLMEALKKEPNFYIRVAILTLLLVGQRKSETLSMKWSDLDLNAGIWTIPRTKTGRPHSVPLPQSIWKSLENLPRVLDNEHVFPGSKTGGHLVNIDKAWREIRKNAHIEGVRLHDLRRTVGSWMAGSGTSLPIIGKTLGHTQPQTTQIYARVDLAVVRRALNEYSQNILMIGEGKKE